MEDHVASWSRGKTCALRGDNTRPGIMRWSWTATLGENPVSSRGWKKRNALAFLFPPDQREGDPRARLSAGASAAPAHDVPRSRISAPRPVAPAIRDGRPRREKERHHARRQGNNKARIRTRGQRAARRPLAHFHGEIVDRAPERVGEKKHAARPDMGQGDPVRPVPR